ncbi:hypothetical protein SDC9_84550 [bioreactor metagenome]|uniref:Uncharacterized protein n=1 Tax=bioreactor metagenome TaxID=1076179 RepID=A0A644ZCB6_9ZZZZ
MKLEQKIFYLKDTKEIANLEKLVKGATRFCLPYLDLYSKLPFFDDKLPQYIENEIFQKIKSRKSIVSLEEISANYVEAYGEKFICDMLYIADYYDQYKLIPMNQYERYLVNKEIMDIYNYITNNLDVKEISISLSKTKIDNSSNKAGLEGPKIKVKSEYDQNQSTEIMNSLELKSKYPLKPQNCDGNYPYAVSIDELNKSIDIAKKSSVIKFSQTFLSNQTKYYKFLLSGKVHEFGFNFERAKRNEEKYILKINFLL